MPVVVLVNISGELNEFLLVGQTDPNKRILGEDNQTDVRDELCPRERT